MKGMRVLAALLGLTLAGCGSGSIQSPDFTKELSSITVAPPTASIAAGNTVQLTVTGTYTSPPGEDPTTGTVSASFSSNTTSIATVDSKGLVTGVAEGSAVITASAGGLSAQSKVTVTAPTLLSIIIQHEPDSTHTQVKSDSIPVGTSREYSVTGNYTDKIPRDIAATWVSSAPTVATVATPPDPTHVKSVAVPTTAANGAQSNITATSTTPMADGVTFPTATMVITATQIQLTQISSVTLNPASPIAVGTMTQASAVGTYSDGSTATIPNSEINWTTGDNTLATVDATGLVTANSTTTGTVTVIATLKSGDETQVSVPANRTAQTSLTINSAGCAGGFRAPAASVTSSVSASCVGCSVSDANNVIDADTTSSALMSLGLGLGGSTSIVVTNQTPLPGGGNAGFIVSSTSGVELGGSVTLSTLLQGNVVDTTSLTDPTSVSVLGLTVIAGITRERDLVTLPTTGPYDSLEIDFGAGVVVNSSLNVYDACSAATP